MSLPQRIVPEIDADNERFWASCDDHAMELQRCARCGRYRYFPSPVCPGCSSTAATWLPVSGRATVFTYSVLHRPASPAYAEDVPYVYAVVELEEGPMMPTNLVEFDLPPVIAGKVDLIARPVEVRYHELVPGVTLPVFAPAPEPAR
jgi:uncharacterized OB-fold protein